MIWHYIKKRRFDGEIGLRYLLWNGIGRAFCESLRTDALFVGKVRISQAVCITYATIAAILLIVIKNRIKKSSDPDYLKPYAESREYLILTGQLPKEPAAERAAETAEEAVEAGEETVDAVQEAAEEFAEEAAETAEEAVEAAEEAAETVKEAAEEIAEEEGTEENVPEELT